METAGDDLGLTATGQFFETVLITKDVNEEKQPFITQKIVNDMYEDKKQNCEQKHRVDLLRLRVPILILVYAYYGYLYTVPYLPISQFFIYLWFVPTSVVLFVSYWTFYVAAYSHPGRVPLEYVKWDGTLETKPNVPIYSEISESKIIQSGYQLNPNDQEKLFCTKCDQYRPLRTHHCSQCKTCIARMDHHCDFLNNCVGINNNRYFCQFLAWVFFILLDYEFTYYYSYPYIKEKESYLTYLGASFMWYIGILILISVAIMNVTNLKYIFYNDTLVETRFKINQINKFGYVSEINGFDRGPMAENFKVVCGTSKLRWIFPLKWTKSDLNIRMMSHSYQCDICPCNR